MAFNPVTYIKETRAEMKHVSWPTRTTTLQYTVLTVVISVAIAYYLGFFDFAIGEGLSRVIGTDLPSASLDGIGDVLEGVDSAPAASEIDTAGRLSEIGEASESSMMEETDSAN